MCEIPKLDFAVPLPVFERVTSEHILPTYPGDRSHKGDCDRLNLTGHCVKIKDDDFQIKNTSEYANVVNHLVAKARKELPKLDSDLSYIFLTINSAKPLRNENTYFEELERFKEATSKKRINIVVSAYIKDGVYDPYTTCIVPVYEWYWYAVLN